MEIRCVKNGWAIRFEVPPGEDPTDYGKKKLRVLTGKKRLVGWEFETVV